MNEYKTRSQYEHYTNTNPGEPTSMATCYEAMANPGLPYNSSGSYNMPQPFNTYQPPYFEPQNSSMGVQHPEMHAIPPLRHDSHFSEHTLRHPGGYVGPSGYSPDASSRFVSSRYGLAENELESQDSANEDNMLSERMSPPLDGFPHVEDFDKLMKSYVDDLSIKKQDKALINAQRARHIRNVLTDPKDTTIGSAQFRFWVKKMFKLEPLDSRIPMTRKWICHEGKPVAIREKLFKILTRAHQQCQHGGRDKTSAQVRQLYSWVPKELISRFVKICPTCQVRRGGSHLSPPDSRRNSPPMELPRAQQQQQEASSTYMRAHQPPSPSAYDEYRRNSSSSSSFGYHDSRNREPTWAYSSPSSRHSEVVWSTSSHHQHPSNRQHGQQSIRSPPPPHHMDSDGRSQSGRYPSTSSSSSNHMKLLNMHIDDSSPPSPGSESMIESSPSQAHYGYVQTHANSRYRTGY